MVQNEHKNILVKRNIEKSQEAYEAAENLFKSNHLTSALNRIYYAIFYTVTALAYKNDFTTSKHSKLMGWFNRRFIYEDKVFNEGLFKIYSKAFSYRQDSDYNAMYIPDAELVNQLLADAKKFITEVRNVI